MPKKVNKKFLEDMFSKAPQTTLGIKKILTLDTKKGIATAVYSAKKKTFMLFWLKQVRDD